MPDRTSAPDRTDDVPLDDDAGWTPDLDDAPPVARSRRRLVTPWTLGLGAVVLVTAGFIGGVQVQKGQADGGTAAAGSGGGALRGGFAGARGGGGGAGATDGAVAGDAAAQDAPTFGSVANKKGSTLYVEGSDGTTVRVKTNAQSKVTRTAAASAKGIYPGDTVVVQGTKDEDGNIVATQITATSQTAAANGGGGLGRMFGGGGGARGDTGGAGGAGAGAGGAGAGGGPVLVAPGG